MNTTDTGKLLNCIAVKYAVEKKKTKDEQQDTRGVYVGEDRANNFNTLLKLLATTGGGIGGGLLGSAIGANTSSPWGGVNKGGATVGGLLGLLGGGLGGYGLAHLSRLRPDQPIITIDK